MTRRFFRTATGQAAHRTLPGVQFFFSPSFGFAFMRKKTTKSPRHLCSFRGNYQRRTSRGAASDDGIWGISDGRPPLPCLYVACRCGDWTTAAVALDLRSGVGWGTRRLIDPLIDRSIVFLLLLTCWGWLLHDPRARRGDCRLSSGGGKWSISKSTNRSNAHIAKHINSLSEALSYLRPTGSRQAGRVSPALLSAFGPPHSRTWQGVYALVLGGGLKSLDALQHCTRPPPPNCTRPACVVDDRSVRQGLARDAQRERLVGGPAGKNAARARRGGRKPRALPAPQGMYKDIKKDVHVNYLSCRALCLGKCICMYT